MSWKVTTDRLIRQVISKIDTPEGVTESMTVKLTPHAFAWYFALTPSEQTHLHEQLATIPEIELRFLKKVQLGVSRTLEMIEVREGAALLQRWNIIPLSVSITQAIESLGQTLFKVPWWPELRESVTTAWASDKACMGLKRDQVVMLEKAMRLIEYLTVEDNAVFPDLRTVSTTLFGDSKLLESKPLSNLVYRLMQPYLDDEVATMVTNGTELLEYFGITKYPIPIRFKLKGEIRCSDWINVAPVRQGIGLSPDEIVDVRFNEPPAYILFIENRASFERYVREIQDSGLVVYTAGFPPRAWVNVFRLFVDGAGDGVSVFHWGDRDPGGYRILAYLAKALHRDIQPYRMGVEEVPDDCAQGGGVTRNVEELKNALLSAVNYPAIRTLYDSLEACESTELEWIEQEGLAPISPLEFNRARKSA